MRRAAITAAAVASIHKLIAVAWLRKKVSGLVGCTAQKPMKAMTVPVTKE